MNIYISSTQLHPTVILPTAACINAAIDESIERKVRNAWVNQLCPLSWIWHKIRVGELEQSKVGGRNGWMDFKQKRWVWIEGGGGAGEGGMDVGTGGLEKRINACRGAQGGFEK